MADVRRDLRAASDALRRDLDALSTLEDEKRQMSFDDPRLPEVARQVEEIAARLLDRSGTQTDLTESAVASGGTGSIESTNRAPADVLAEWRELERRAAAAEPGSAEATEVAVLLERMRAEYRAAFDASQAEPDRRP